MSLIEREVFSSALSIAEYEEIIALLSDSELEETASFAIYLATFELAFTRRTKWDDKAQACFNECTRRGRPDIYERAYERAFNKATGERR
jgi:hypothetical protein